MVRSEPHRLRYTPPLQESLTAFDSPEWCRKLVHDETLIPIVRYARRAKPDSEDSLVAGTLKTPATIPAWQSYYRYFHRDQPQDKSETAPVAGELLSLVSLGPGLNGHADTAHGGIISVILDEVTGDVAYLHMDRGSSAFMAFLHVTYKKRLPTPSVVLCRGWLEKRSVGRKLWLKATIEDGLGTVYSEAECLYIQATKNTQKL